VGGEGEAEGARCVDDETAREEREHERKEGEGERDMYLDRIPSGNDDVAVSTKGITYIDMNGYIYITVAIQTFYAEMQRNTDHQQARTVDTKT